MTGNRIRDSKRNPFFQVKVKDGKYSTENHRRLAMSRWPRRLR